MKKNSESGYVQHIRKNANTRKSWAQTAMGDVFYFGIGMQEEFNNMNENKKHRKVEDNHKKAFEWYQKAAKQGERVAMVGVGDAYYFGEGIKENHKKAFEWYQKAANAGDIGALYSLARMYERGLGVKRNLPEAEKLYLTAINEHADADSLYPLARMYLENDEIKASSQFIFRLLMVAQNEVNIATDRYIEYLWDELSPMQHNQMRETIYDDLQRDWNPKMQDAISGINERIEVAEPSSKSLSAEDVFNRIWRSVVYIETSNGSSGSGVIVQPDIVATNHHVVKGAKGILVFQPKELNGKKNVPYPARLRPMRADGGEDYCLLHVPNLPGSGIPATIRRYDTLKVGETVYALGAPEGEVLSLSKGIISQKRDMAFYSQEYTPTRAIQSDVDSAPGSSGGGLFDSAGYLIGHPTFGSDEKGLEFSIPADIILEFGKEQEPE